MTARKSKTPTRAEQMSKQMTAVMKALQGTTEIMDDKDKVINLKLNLQGNILIGIINALEPTLPKLEEVPEEAIKVWKEVYLFNHNLYVINTADSSGEAETGV